MLFKHCCVIAPSLLLVVSFSGVSQTPVSPAPPVQAPAAKVAPALGEVIDSPVFDLARVERLAQERLAGARGQSLVVGLFDKNGPRIVARGDAAKGSKASGDTIYELGGVSKLLTGALLASAAGRGEVRRTETLGTTLKLEGEGRNLQFLRGVRLEALATHAGGVPRLPCNLKPFDAANPYAGYDDKNLMAFAGDGCWQPIEPPRYEFSSVGYSLLAAALAAKTQKSYYTLLQDRVLEPLGMTATFHTVPGQLRARLAQPHAPDGRATPVWDLDAMAPALGLKSSVNDLLKLAGRLAKPEKEGIDRVLALAAQPRAATDIPNTATGMGWLITDFGGRKITWLTAGTFGSAAFVAVDRDQGRAVVILTNSAMKIDDLGLHLLMPEAPLAQPRARDVDAKPASKAAPESRAKSSGKPSPATESKK